MPFKTPPHVDVGDDDVGVNDIWAELELDRVGGLDQRVYFGDGPGVEFRLDNVDADRMNHDHVMIATLLVLRNRVTHAVISTLMESPRYAVDRFTNPPNYSFPHHRLARTVHDPNKTPLVLVGCGSFSPVTYLHLRMFEMAKDYVRQNTNFEIVGSYLSPVSDMYKKAGLLSAQHRCVYPS